MVYVVMSVISGLCSWFVPFIKTKRITKHYKTIISFSLCLLSIYFQILLMKSYGDQWTLTVDAVGALTAAIPLLAVGTVVSNIISDRKM